MTSEMSATADISVGTILDDRYVIVRKLGQGGMGTVYLAQHAIIEKLVAIKILSGDFASKTESMQRFLQEARAAARIGQENIVEVFDFGETEDSVYFAMEYLEGKDLAQVIREAAPLPLGRLCRIMVQICRALGAAHGKGIIHRDLKPENIFLIEKDERDDFVKVLDFGIAKITDDGNTGERLTRAGMIFGTPEYMAPEQASGDAPDHRADIYALGCILYELLTGTPPFVGDSFMKVLTRQMLEAPKPPSQQTSVPIPMGLESVCLIALEKAPERRFQSMQELLLALEAASMAGETQEDPGYLSGEATVVRARPVPVSVPPVTSQPGPVQPGPVRPAVAAPPRTVWLHWMTHVSAAVALSAMTAVLILVHRSDMNGKKPEAVQASQQEQTRGPPVVPQEPPEPAPPALQQEKEPESATAHQASQASPLSVPPLRIATDLPSAPVPLTKHRRSARSGKASSGSTEAESDLKNPFGP